ncbi:MAG: hypothetical protein H0W62_13840 [Chitinophagales bacterium]|nr:hypothetical protein [Chitinophagales bacterium]
MHFDFIYKGNSPLPAVLNYYYPGITDPPNDELIFIDSFQYNIQGQIIKDGFTNLLSPEYNGAYIYTYNKLGNVKRAMVRAENGGTVFNPGYTINEAAGYDNNRNFMAGSKWIKYILFHSEVDPADYFRMFCRNNPLNWTWNYSDGTFSPISASYIYDSEGFANTVNLSLLDTDGITEVLAFTETSSSTCDNLQEPVKYMPSNRVSSLRQKPGILMGMLPSTTVKK